MYDEPFLKLVKSNTLKALLSDDDLMEKLVFKGGNAITMIYNISSRASMDLDFSIEEDFKDKEIIKTKIEILLKETFVKETNYNVINFKFEERPKVSSNEFWGGYAISFQLIDKKVQQAIPIQKEDFLGGRARPIYDQVKTFTVDISKYEYCGAKRLHKFDGYNLYVYTSDMIVFEKIRSICQQTEEYKKIVRCSISPRARDFFDIYNIIETLNLDIATSESLDLLKAVFDIKKVPLKLIFEIDKYYDFHYKSFDALKETVSKSASLKEFKFYFDYLVNKIKNLKDNITSKFPSILD